MGFIPIAALIAAKAGKAYFDHRSKNKKAKEQKKTTVAGLNINQKQHEDSRRASLALGGSMMNNIPATTGDGSIRTNAGIDPALLAQLGMERTYDFGSAVPDQAAGNGSAFLSGLFGTAGDAISGAYGGTYGGMGGNAAAAAGGNIVGDSSIQSGGPGSATSTVSWQDLLKQYGDDD